MQIKKYPNATLENYSKVLIQLGLVLSLFIVYEFMRMKSYPEPIKALTGTFIGTDDSEQSVLVKRKEIPPQPKAQPVMPERILKVEDDIDVVETIIETTETDEDEAVIVVEREEIVSVGCKGNNAQLRACFSENITNFVKKEFNPELASDLGLQQGSIQKIFVVFRIDEKGNISRINARAPHKSLQAEAIRIIKMLPRMEPGKQRGKPVGVSYGLPIVFKVE
jgi:protein TonB